MIQVGAQKTRILTEVRTRRGRLRRFQMVTRIVLGNELFMRLEIKGSRLTDLKEDISRQPHIQSMEWNYWLLSAIFMETKKKHKNLKNLNFAI